MATIKRVVEKLVKTETSVVVSDIDGSDLPEMHWSAYRRVVACVCDGAGNKPRNLNIEGTPEQINRLWREIESAVERVKAEFSARRK